MAQINFLNHNVIDINYLIGTVTNAIPYDMDNDGDLDLISSSDTNYIVWQENIDGQGTYGNIRMITDQLSGITSISIADIDGDGDMDIVSTARYVPGWTTYGVISWHENLGQGNFTTHTIAENVTGAYYAKAGDMDGDGDLDIVACTNHGVLGWFKNTNGQGNFSTALPIASGLQTISSIDIADADGDGDNDIVITSWQLNQFMRVGILKNTNGQGTFSAFQLLKNEVPESNYSIVTRVGFHDIDHDGDQDIVFSANNKIITIINTGAGIYTNSDLMVSSLRDRVIDFSFKDLDNDGVEDLAAAMAVWQENDRVFWFKNTGTGYAANSQILQNFTSNGIRSFKIADIDGDGGLDIVTGNYYDNHLVWYKNYTTIKAVSKFCSNPVSAKAADLDNDGDLDVIHAVGTKLVWYKNIDGAGTTGLQKVITFADNINNYELGDLDGDGFKDIVIDQKWFKNDGAGNFTPITYVDTYSDFRSSVYIHDVDNDGDNDLIAVDNLSNGSVVIGWFKNLNGLGNFGPRQSIIFLSGTTVSQINFADMDGDGDKDIVFSGGKLGIIKNLDGAGTFDSTFQSVYSYTCQNVSCADIDGDGDLDILFGNISSGSDKVGWFKNLTGVGDFAYSPQFIGDSTISGAIPADMDNDGDIDIVTTQASATKTVWLENVSGLGTFGQPVTLINHSQEYNSSFIADIDNDGKLDILSSSTYGDHPVSWLKNNGLSLNKITGTIKLDLNHNGCDTADNAMPNVKVVTQINDTTYATFTANNGYYQFYVEEPGTYTTSVASTLPSYFTVSPSSQTTTFASNNGAQTVNFCVTDNQVVNDLDITIYPTSDARPGFTSSYVIAYHNKGTTQLSGNVKLQFDASKLSLSSSNPVVTSQTANELTFNFSNLNPFETRLVRVVFQIFAPPIVNIDEILNFTAIVNPVAGDATPADNISELNQLVIGSYDPNDITVLEGESILIDEIDDYLHYVIRFQNTGTASAINVTVTNTLDDNLDWNSLQVGAISHNNYVEIRNGNDVSFVFKNIYLPALVVNEPASHGFICYKIKPKSTSVAGDLFHNEAQIYFDYNTAIHTNKVTTEVLMPLNKPDFKDSKVSLYPNPTNGKIYLTANFEVKTITVYNIYGQEISGNQNNLEIDISAFSSGMYFINIENADGKIITKKVIKK